MFLTSCPSCQRSTCSSTRTGSSTSTGREAPGCGGPSRGFVLTGRRSSTPGSNEFASPYDITFETIFESYSQLTRLLNNSFDHVTITGVSYRSLIGPDYHAYHLGKVERRVGGSWVKMSRRNTTVSRGSTMHLRVTLNRVDSPGQVVVPVNVDVPKGRGRGFGYLQLSGGASTYGGGGKATSFDSLLDQLANATHNNSVVAQLRINQPGPNYKATQARSTDQVVTGQFFASIQVR